MAEHNSEQLEFALTTMFENDLSEMTSLPAASGVSIVDDNSEVPVINDEIMMYLSVYVFSILHGVVAIFGTVNNLLNTLIFWRLGLRDSMAVGLFALSITDFLVAFLRLLVCVCYLKTTFYPQNAIDLFSIQDILFTWTRYIAYLVSCWITALLALERCFCVVSPFHVKRVFTKGRCIFAIVTIYVIHYSAHIPVFMSHRIEWVLVTSDKGLPPPNSTMSSRWILTVTYHGKTEKMIIIADVIAGISLSIICQIVVIVCTVWMIYALKASSRVRSGGLAGRVNEMTTGKNWLPSVKMTTAEKETQGENLSPREKRLIKVVMFLAVILTACNIPRFVVIVVDAVIPDIEYGLVQANLGVSMWEIVYFLGTINCSVNIFVYYSLNSGYKTAFNELMGRNTEDKNNSCQ